MTTDEERWAQAEEILRNNPGPEARRRIRQRKILVWSVIGGSIVLGLLGGFLVVLLAGHHPEHHAEPPLWQTITVIAFSVAGVVVDAIALIGLWRSGQLRNRWSTPMTVLTWSQRRALSRQVLGKVPVDPARLPLARDLARRLSLTTRNQLLIFLGLVLIYTSQLLLGPTGPRLWLFLVAIAFWLVVAPLAVRQNRRVQRFLAEHGDEEDV